MTGSTTTLVRHPHRLGARHALFCIGTETTTGPILETMTGSGAAWADTVVASLGPRERAIASIGFAPDTPGIAHRMRIDAQVGAGRGDDTVGDQLEHEVRHTHQVVEQPSTEQYAANVRTALGHIDAGRLEKVVLGRSLDVLSDPPLDPDLIIDRLRTARPGRYVFGVPLAAGTDAPLLLGASPELLVRRRGSAVSSFPLAGSIPRVPDPVEDRRRAEALLESTKDLHEHAFVVEAIVEALERVCAHVSVDAHPRLVSTDQLHHLGTRIDAILAADRPAPSALHLAQLLQPTPAVGGTPRAAAIDLIHELEGDRGMLTGATGWVDARGDGELAVTIRAGVLDGQHLRLFAGAGIVAGSDPESEVRETGAKLATMRAAVGV